MSETKTISKKKRGFKRDKASLKQLVKQNPKLQTLIDKLDLQLTKY